MYIKDNKAYPKGLVEIEAQENNMSLEDYVSQNNFSLLEESEGKPTDPPKKNQSGDQEEVKTDGESSSVNGSLESPGPKPASEVQTTGLPGVDLALQDEAEDASIINDVVLDEVEVVGKKMNLSELLVKLEAIDEDSEVFGAYNNLFNFEINPYNGLYYPAIADSVKKQRAKDWQEKQDNKKWWQKGLLGTLEQREVYPESKLEDILASLSPEASKEYSRLLRAAGLKGDRDSHGLTKEEIEEFGFANYLKTIPGAETAINNAIAEKRSKQTDLFFANKTQEERDAYLLFIPGSPEYNEAMNKAIEYNAKTFRKDSDKNPLNKENLPERAKEIASYLRKTFEKSYSALEAQGEYLEDAKVKIDADSEKLNDLIKKHQEAFAEMEAALPEKPQYTRIRPFQIIGEQDPVMEQAFREKYASEAGEYNKAIEKMSDYRDQAVVEIEGLRNNLVGALRDFNQRIDIYTKAYDKLNKDQKVLSVTEAVVGSVTKNWSMLDRTLLSLEDFFIGSVVGLDILGAEIVAELTDENSEIHKTAKKLQGGWIDYQKYLGERREQLPYLGSLTDGDIENFGLYTLSKFADGLPSMVSVLGPQGIATYLGKKAAAKAAINIGKKEVSKQFTASFVAKSQKSVSRFFTMPVFGIVGGGSRANTITNLQLEADKIKKQLNEDLKNASTQFQKDEISKELEYIDNVANMPLYVKAGQVLFSGLVEPFSEATGSIRFARNLQRFSKPVAYSQIRGLIKNHQASKFLAGTFGTLKATGMGLFIETAEEVTAETLNNGVDIYNGKPISIFENINKDFAYGTFINVLGMQGGGSFSGLAGLYKTAMYNRSQNKEHKALANDFLTLQAEIEGLKEVEQTNEVIEEIKGKELAKVGILNALLKTQVNASINVASLSQQDFKELIRLEAEQRYLANQASNLGSSGQLEGRKDIENLKQSFADLEEQRQAILSKKENQTKEEADALAKEAKVEGARKAEMLTLLSLYEYHKGVSMASYGDNMSVVNSNEDIDNLDISDVLKQSLKNKALFDSEEAVGDNGYYDIKTGKYYIFEGNVKLNISTGGLNAVIAAASPSHELGHAQIRAAGIIKDEKIVGIADGLVKELLNVVVNLSSSGKISEKESKALSDRIDNYKKENDGKHDVDELIQLMVELKAGGYIDGAAMRQMWQAKALINSLYSKIYKNQAPYFKLETQEDVLGFIETWENSTRAVMPPEEEEAFEGKKSKSLLQDINALVPESVQTQADFFDRKIFNPIYNDGKLHPAIANYIRSRSVSKEEGDRIIESVADRLINFNPEATRKTGDAKITFGEFLFANVNFGKLDARKALFEEGQERSQTESTDTEQAKQIATVETVSEQQSEKPTYKNLLRRRVLDSGVVDAIKSKVMSTVRVMKTRMDESVSKNVTVKPYIAELRKAMGKQADIDFKKAMGGLKDGQLRKFLLKNKAAILENMTTTWLMTAMPNAVQKQVDGVFTSDWKGKKIDREKVSTNQAGRTSGAEIVRRLPNASTRLSDADFLSNFFTEDGKLIRGRKESLAKAMAEEISFDIINEALQDSNSEIRKALEQRQDLLGVELLDNYVTQVAADIERGNAKASLSLGQFNEMKGRMNAIRDIISKQNSGNLTKSRLKNAIIKVFEDDPSDLISEKEIKAFVNESFNTIKRYFSKPEAQGVDFTSFVEEGVELAKQKSNLMRALDIAKSSLIGGYKALFENKNLVNRQRGLSLDFNTKIISEKGEAGLILALKWMRGHQTTSGKIGGGRMQIYAGVTDFINNNLNTIPGVKIEYKIGGAGVVITNVSYKGETVKDWKKLIATPAQTATRKVTRNGVGVKEPISKQTFVEQYDQRLEAAREAWTMLTDYLSYVNENGSKLDWVMTMMSLKSNMSSMLKAAAPVKYYHTGKSTAKLRYEHMIPTEYMVLKLTQHFKIKNIDLNKLRDKYNVAIIPIKMDDNFNILVQSQMNSDFNLETDSEVFRYYNKSTYGFKNMEAIEVIGGQNKGTVIGEGWVKFNEKINPKNLEASIKKVKEIETAKPKLESKSSTSLNDLNKEFNNILERKTGIESFKTFSDVQAEIRGRKKGRFKFFIAPAVDDFRGLVNFAFSGKGKQGEIDKQWLEDKLMTPYAKGIAAIEGIRQQIKRDFKAAVKAFPKQYKLLNKTIGTSPFTYDHAVRVYLWQKAGFDTIPGLSKKDMKVLQDAIQAQPELMVFANSLLTVARRDEWIAPTEHWVGGTVLSDLNGMTEKIGRKKYLEEFIANAEVIFSKENLNKIEAAFGKNHREAIEDALYSMINGTNRSTGASQNKTVGKWLNWINGSTGAIMFFNRRSALLQMLSTVNFINYTDNNPVKAAAAFANQKQYWKDFVMIFNSDKLKERRGGLQQDVSSDEIASIANKSNRSPQALLARLLKLGFTPTQIADSMAIASGGATFYRNRVNTYLKQGMDQAAAEKQAFLDFSKISDETQQSSDPALVSQIQRSVLGRIVFAFQNTPMQMTRLMKKDALDLINGRGDWKVKAARIAYYGAIQNAIFSSLQSALFALIPGFDDEDDEDLTEEELIKRNTQEEGKIARALNSMLDTVLRGSGVYGAILAASKNVIREYNKQEAKGFLGDHSYTILSLFDISPPIGSKARKINTAIKTKTFEKDAIAERGWAVTAEGRLNLGPNWSILGNVVSATTNVPLDRVVAELTSVAEAFNAKNTAWQRVALGAGWKTWDVGVKNEINEKIKEAAKERRKEEGVIKAKETRKANRKAKEEEIMKSLLKNIQTQDSIIEYNKGKK